MEIGAHYGPCNHNKTTLDGHFSNLGYWVKEYGTSRDAGVYNSVDIRDAILWGNIHKKAQPSKKYQVKYIPIVFDISSTNESNLAMLRR